MSKEKPFPVLLDVSEPPPEPVDLGARFHFVVAIETDAPVDLAGAPLEVFHGADKVASFVLPAITLRDPQADDYDPRNGPVDFRPGARIELMAPDRVGSFDWRLVLPAGERDGVAWERAELDFSFATAIHRASLAAWDVTSPVVAGQTLSVTVGAKCGAGCDMSGHRIELRDDGGHVVARGSPGDTPWPGTEALYWTKLEAAAPDAPGLRQWSLAFVPAEVGPPHQDASTTISFMVVPPGKHRVEVCVVERETRAPLAEAQLRLGYHRGETDSSGRACFTVAPGEHNLFVWKADHEIPELTLDVAADMEVRLEAIALPPDDPYARWTS